MKMPRIYRIELERALDEGFEGVEAERIARQRAEEKYYEMADDARADCFPL